MAAAQVQALISIAEALHRIAAVIEDRDRQDAFTGD